MGLKSINFTDKIFKELRKSVLKTSRELQDLCNENNLLLYYSSNLSVKYKGLAENCKDCFVVVDKERYIIGFAPDESIDYLYKEIEDKLEPLKSGDFIPQLKFTYKYVEKYD